MDSHSGAVGGTLRLYRTKDSGSNLTRGTGDSDHETGEEKECPLVVRVLPGPLGTDTDGEGRPGRSVKLVPPPPPTGVGTVFVSSDVLPVRSSRHTVG